MRYLIVFVLFSMYPEAILPLAIAGSDIVCITEEKENPDTYDSIRIKTCRWKQYKTVDVGTPDFKSTYSHVITLYEIRNDGEYEIKNSFLFNDRVKEFEVLLNERIKGEFNEYIAEEELNKTFKDYELPYYTLDDIQLSFEERGVFLFQAQTGLGGAYFNLSTVYISYKPDQLQVFLK